MPAKIALQKCYLNDVKDRIDFKQLGPFKTLTVYKRN